MFYLNQDGEIQTNIDADLILAQHPGHHHVPAAKMYDLVADFYTAK